MGLQTVDRAVAVLHLLSVSGPGGLRLVDVADPTAPHMARLHAAQRIIERAEGATPQRRA